MAVLAVAAAGAWAGYAAFGTGAVLMGMSGAQLGWMAGSIIGNAMFAPTQKSQGPRLGDLTVSGSAYGTPIPWIAGSPRVSGQAIWASAKREIANTQSAGGKGGGGSEYTTYTYEVDLLILLTDNEIAGVSRIWKNGELVYGDGTTKDGLWSRMTAYTGAADQLPDPDYEAAVGTANAPAYRGRGTVFIKSLQLGGSGQIPNLTFEVGNHSSYLNGFLLRFNNPSQPNVYIDEGGNTWSLLGIGSLTNVEVTSTKSKFGGGSLKVSMPDGNIRYIYRNYGNVTPAGNKFTIQCFFYTDGTYVDSQTYLCNLINTSGTGFSLNNNPLRGGLRFQINDMEPITYSISANSWHFVEANYDGSTQRLYVDGVLRASAVVSSGTQKTFYAATVGVITGGASGWKDYVDDLRVTFGVARHESSVPTEQLKNDLEVNIVETLPENVQDVIDHLLLRTGLQTAQYDTSALSAITTQVRALAISQVSNARTVLEMLCATYHIEAVVSDKIYFRPRGGAPAATIDWEDLGAGLGTDADPLPLRLANELEIPAQMAITYANIDADHQTDTQYSDRLLTGQQSTSAVQLPLAMTPSEAKALSDAMLFDKAVQALTTTVALDVTHAALEPSDVLLITGEDASTYRMRVIKRKEAEGVITLDCVQDDATVFTQAGTTDTGYTAQTTVAATPNTTFAPLDLPLLRDADDTPGVYLAVTGAAANWSACAIYDSLDDVTYTQRQTLSTQAAIGTCTTTLGNWTGGNVFDETNTVTVDVGLQELASVTWADIIASDTLNAALIGDELVQYRNAALVSTGVYTLSGLLRGRRGTEATMTGHAASERFIALGETGLTFLTLSSAALGTPRYYKAVSAGQALSAVTAQQITPLGANLTPLAPVHPRANRDAADTVITWTRRTRLDTRITGPLPMSVPLGEATEAYEVEVWDAGYTTLKRTISTTTPSATYTAAQQTTDFGSAQTTLYLRIYQISATVGRGKPLTASI